MDCRRRAETTEQQAAAHRAAKRFTVIGVDAVVKLLNRPMLDGQRSVVEQNVVGLLKHLNRLRLDGLQTAVVQCRRQVVKQFTHIHCKTFKS